MNDNGSKPGPKSSGNRPPPRPPKHTIFALGPDDDDDPGRKQPKKDTVRINLPPKPSSVPTIKLPTLPSGQFPIEAKLPKKSPVPALALAATCHPRGAARTLELIIVLAAVLLLNSMLCILRCL
jgi:hypothetical protein